MKEHPEDLQGFCCFHPKEIVVGVCALCLYDRLQILAAKQAHGRLSLSRRRTFNGSCNTSSLNLSPINLHKIFSFSGIFTKHLKYGEHPHDFVSSSYEGSKSIKKITSSSVDSTWVYVHEDSFISMKFEGNGEASWDKSKGKQKEQTNVDDQKNCSLARWRKRIGCLFQFSRLKVCHVGGRWRLGRSRSKKKWKE